MAWTEIETQTLTTTAASVVFSTGLSGYKFFRLTGYVLNDGVGNNEVLLRLNNSSSGYTTQAIEAASTAVQGARATATSAEVTGFQNFAASQAGSFVAIIAKPAAGVEAQIVSQAGYNTTIVLALAGSEWNNTADLISRIDVIASSNNFAAGTSILLEGLSY